jgi:hypothetical protein
VANVGKNLRCVAAFFTFFQMTHIVAQAYVDRHERHLLRIYCGV